MEEFKTVWEGNARPGVVIVPSEDVDGKEIFINRHELKKGDKPVGVYVSGDYFLFFNADKDNLDGSEVSLMARIYGKVTELTVMIGTVEKIEVKVETVVNSDWVEKLKEVKVKNKDKFCYEEDNHMESDAVLCELLVSLGYEDVVLEYKKEERFFSVEHIS